MAETESAQERHATSPGDPDDLQPLTHHAAFPETRFSKLVDKGTKALGSAVSWFWILLMAVICINVFMKNFLGQGSVRLEEVQWHIFSAVFLVGLSYALAFDDHVRVDLLYERFDIRTKAWIEILGTTFCLLPFLAVLLYFTWPFVVKAFVDVERSSSPAGLSHYWIIKSALVIGFVLLVISAFARLHRCIQCLRAPVRLAKGE